MLTVLLGLVAVGLGAPPPQDAETQAESTPAEPRARARAHLDLAFVTNVPGDVGGKLTLQLPAALQLGLGVGVMPKAYYDVTASLAGSLAGEEAETFTRMAGDIQTHTLVVQPTLGIKPGRNLGFVMDLGYRWVRMRGNPSGNDLVGDSFGIPHEISAALESPWAVQTTIHQVSAHIGWQFVAAKRLVFRLDVGGSFTVDAHTGADPSSTAGLPDDWQTWVGEGEERFDVYLRKYAHIPTVGLSIGYRLF